MGEKTASEFFYATVIVICHNKMMHSRDFVSAIIFALYKEVINSFLLFFLKKEKVLNNIIEMIFSQYGE